MARDILRPPLAQERLHCSNSDALRVVALASGSNHNRALIANSGVRCWGRNDYGQLGDATLPQCTTLPTKDLLMGVQAIAAGGEHTCVLMVSGGVRRGGN